MKVADSRLQSNIVQFFSREEQKALISQFNAQDGDVLMMIADTSRDTVNQVLCSLRLYVAARLNLVSPESYRPLWVTAFPLFELKDDQLRSQHHPFTMPDRTDFDPEDREDLIRLNSRAYDIVINGEEVGGGSVRIHEMDIQERIFKALGLSAQEAELKFGFFLKALEYGAPPHAGLALGMDRITAMILKASSIRDVIAFPKNRRALCPLTRAPSPADNDQLEELGISRIPHSGSDADSSVESAGRHAPGGQPPAPKRISKKQVLHVAKLARLKLSKTEVDGYRKDLNAILEYVQTLEKLDTDNVRPMSHVLEIKNVWREDVSVGEKETETLLENAPMREENYFKVPKILEG
jgi:aspartyl-tRNA synthetase